MTEKAFPNTNTKSKILLIVFSYLFLYGVFELTAHLTGDTIQPENALIISVCVLAGAWLIELLVFRNNIREIAEILGLGKPGISSMVTALVITLLLFLCYPVITTVTGFEFRIPVNWLPLAAGVFVLHGIAEEVLYRGFLFRHLRKGRSFSRAAWLAVVFFTLAHIPIILNQGLLVGGMAVLLAVVSSFPFSYLYEKGNFTIWAPAIVHSAIDTIIPILAEGPMDSSATMAATLWMAACMIIPYLAFVILRKTSSSAIIGK